MSLQRIHWFKHAKLGKTLLPRAPINENTMHTSTKIKKNKQ